MAWSAVSTSAPIPRLGVRPPPPCPGSRQKASVRCSSSSSRFPFLPDQAYLLGQPFARCWVCFRISVCTSAAFDVRRPDLLFQPVNRPCESRRLRRAGRPRRAVRHRRSRLSSCGSLRPQFPQLALPRDDPRLPRGTGPTVSVPSAVSTSPVRVTNRIAGQLRLGSQCRAVGASPSSTMSVRPSNCGAGRPGPGGRTSPSGRRFAFRRRRPAVGSTSGRKLTRPANGWPRPARAASSSRRSADDEVGSHVAQGDVDQRGQSRGTRNESATSPMTTRDSGDDPDARSARTSRTPGPEAFLGALRGSREPRCGRSARFGERGTIERLDQPVGLARYASRSWQRSARAWRASVMRF